ncbi:hypothetical protein ACOI1C_01215 [Bacillus sp. DJP31]|uniref:hypothetical protein n=1 Tax=Bacillus sp. DJP31 TaxID=3409789 RepID=UPI003BB488AC
MSLKLLELQVALPRTIDASKIQEQMQQRGQNMQDHITTSMLKQEDRKRKQVVKNEKKEKSSLQLGMRSSSVGNLTAKKKEQIQENKEVHPYKGNTIDLNG